MANKLNVINKYKIEDEPIPTKPDGLNAVTAELMNAMIEQFNYMKDMFYPVGSIYMSTNNSNPSTFIGGTWERYSKGRTIFGVDENDPLFSRTDIEGGENTNSFNLSQGWAALALHDNGTLGMGLRTIGERYDVTKYTSGLSVGDGGGASYNLALNLGGRTETKTTVPKYVTTYIWRRTA